MGGTLVSEYRPNV
jgi:hypothetical protein